MQWDIGRTLNIVAHADDDLLFLSPDLLHAIQLGRTVRTIFLTGGDLGAGTDYWQNREFGVQAAYAQMCGVANSWTQTDGGITNCSIPIFTLAGHPSVSLAFMRLPDGNINGSGFSSTDHQSLQQLWTGSISTINTINSSSNYSKATLISTLTSLMLSFQPDQINTQNYTGTYGDGDHSDHHSVAYFVHAAAQHYTSPYSLSGYENYTTSFRRANITGTDLTAKQNAFYAYAHYDRAIGGVPEVLPESWRRNVWFRQIIFSLRTLRPRVHRLLKNMTLFFVPSSTSSCVDMSFAAWLQRQYTVDSVSHDGGDQPLRDIASSQTIHSHIPLSDIYR